MKNYVIALDQRHHQFRAIVFDRQQNIVEIAQRSSPSSIPKPAMWSTTPWRFTPPSMASSPRCWPGQHRPRRSGGHRHHQPAGDHHPLGPQNRLSGVQRHCLAMPPHLADICEDLKNRAWKSISVRTPAF